MAWAAALFVAFGTAVLLTAYLTLASSLRGRDRSDIQETAGDLGDDYLHEGLPALARDAERMAAERPIPELVRLYAADGRALFEHIPPSWADLPYSRLPGASAAPGWSKLDSGRDEEIIELLSSRLKDGTLLQVAQTDSQREDILEEFRWIAAAIMIPTVILGLLLSFLFADRALRPVRELIAVVEAVLAGKSGARVPVPRSHDELERLSLLFNQMLERIEGLIVAMKGSLDNVAHELRTPLARLRASAEEGMSAEVDAQAGREALSDCLEEADRAGEVLAALMDVCEAEAGAMTLTREPIALDELVEEAVELYRYLAEQKHIALSVAAGANAAVAGDRVRLRQVLANLLDNAIKYTPEGGTVRVEVLTRGSEARVVVGDTGPGVAPEDLPRIWDRLYRGRDARAQRGLGLGLSLVRAVVSAHGGRTEAENGPSGGSRFLITLPLASEPASIITPA